jgi:ribonuclease R
MGNPEGKIIHVIGPKGNNNAEMESIVLEKGFEYDYPLEVEKEAQEIEKNKQKILDAEIPKRRDIRKTLTFTIDPVDAKDFDDAISFTELGGGKYEIGVHIADVSHYVTVGSALDKEALEARYFYLSRRSHYSHASGSSFKRCLFAQSS